MPRGVKKVVPSAITPPAPEPLGNLSEADKLAIMGAGPAEITMTASEMLTGINLPGKEEYGVISAGPPPMATPEEVSFGARLATLEARYSELERALEQMAQRFQLPAAPIAISTTQRVIVPASPDEQEAYAKTNFALFQDGLKQHDGIHAWRDAGSPRLEPKPLPPKAGRVA